MTMSEFTPFKVFEEYRLIVMDETTDPDEISFLDAMKFCIGHIVRFYMLPRFKKNANNEEGDKRTLARCVALTSPGPHAFVLITDVLKLEFLESTLRPYREYFGSDLMKYLAVMFIKSEPFRFAPEEYIESSLLLRRLFKDGHDGSRCIIFDTAASEDRKYGQVKCFVKMIEDMFRQNQGQYFSNQIFEESERAIQIETQKKEKEKRLNIRHYEDEKQKIIKQFEDEKKKFEDEKKKFEGEIQKLIKRLGKIEDEKRQKIRQVDDKSKQLKQSNSRSEAAEQVMSQHLIDALLSKQRFIL
ncbi:Hypothetical predicted protein [Mytilus galloprovincialis]|uniref:AIG1-type G domain-containing protein n=1 Tax=Mytilus galloprovincialis TaxID=29158 RepID=A0A8B6D726_MYTGA|nr:Hypothetical predicted protein [Mytilus galloprovincialis]